MRERRPNIDNEFKRMTASSLQWIEKIRRAVNQVIPGAKINLYNSGKGLNRNIKIIIESDSIPNDRLLLNNIIYEILKRAELPIYNPFHIILKSSGSSGFKIDISKPK